MGKYQIELNFKAQFIADVEANDEGEALEKARCMAEDADMNEYTIVDESESRVLNSH